MNSSPNVKKWWRKTAELTGDRSALKSSQRRRISSRPLDPPRRTFWPKVSERKVESVRDEHTLDRKLQVLHVDESDRLRWKCEHSPCETLKDEGEAVEDMAKVNIL